MTNQLASQAIGLTRCAVCKIDMKGRLVYVDDRIEQLLGRTRENLFGKPLHDFVDRRSQELIDRILDQRNHYDTFYDAAEITLVDADGQARPAAAVVSLNFIAGNPVNFQLVLNPTPTGTTLVRHPVSDDDLKDLVTALLEVDSLADWKKFLGILCHFAGVAQAAVYVIGEESLELRSAASDDASASFAFKSIPGTNGIHQQVARTGEEYSVIDQAAVQNAIEQYGDAPGEFIVRLEFGENRQYLLRLVFTENVNRALAAKSIADTRFALSIMQKLVSLRNDSGETAGPTFDIRFTIGFLEALVIAAFATDSDGRIIGYNSTALAQFSEELLEGGYRDVYRHLSQYNKSVPEKQIADFLTDDEAEDGADELRMELTISDELNARLTVIKLGDSEDDQTSCHVFVPIHTSKKSAGALEGTKT